VSRALRTPAHATMDEQHGARGCAMEVSAVVAEAGVPVLTAGEEGADG
jgi:hypothetical protein